MKKLFLIMMAGFLVGCSELSPRTATVVASVIGTYCAAPQDARTLFRGYVNDALNPGTTIRITCPYDEQQDR